MSDPALVLVPCLAGAPWDLPALTPLHGLTVEAPALSPDHAGIEPHADDMLAVAAKHERFILAGDSFGAQVALAAAARRPKGLVGLVMSGGFAANPVDSLVTRLKAGAAAFLPGALYRNLVLPMHAQLLASRFDAEGEHPWSEANTVALFRRNTPWRAYVNRTRASLRADYRSRLKDVRVPTLILTPQDDTLIGPAAAGVLRDGIAGAEETVLERTGHMFRFSHPAAYGHAVRRFLDRRGLIAA